MGTSTLGRSDDYNVLVINQTLAQQPICLRRYDVSLDAFTPCILQQHGGRANVSRDGSRFALVTDVYDGSLRPVSSGGSGFSNGANFYAGLSPDGQTLYEPLYPHLLRVNATTKQIIDNIDIPYYPDVPVHVSPSGKFLVIMDGPGRPTSRITVVNVQ
jgi:hypothetical protein